MTNTIIRTVASMVPDRRVIEQCTDVLRAGGVIVYPTDTVYGLGVDATNPDAVARLRGIKGRDAEKPILAMVADQTMLERYGEVTPLARKLITAFLPGPLALVLQSTTENLAALEGVDGGVGFRIPDHAFCIELTRSFGLPITSTSVNRSGAPQADTVEGMLAQLGAHAHDIALVVDIGALPHRRPSTVVDGRGTEPIVLREGAISRSMLFARLRV